MRYYSILFLLLCIPAFSQSPIERTYVATDKNVYVAGDDVWCSAFCLSSRGFSSFSTVAYLELQSLGGQAATAKIALQSGRGAGKLSLPVSLPTGNYRLIAYTSQNKNEDGYDYMCNGKIISVFNTLGTDRVPDGVKVLPSGEYPGKVSSDSETGNVSLAVSNLPGRSRTLTLTNDGSAPADVSISVYNDDMIVPPASTDIREFVKMDIPADAAGNGSVVPDYEGEVIKARISGKIDSSANVMLSSPGNLSDIYFARADSSGMINYFTGSISGDKEIIVEFNNDDTDAHVVLSSPFVNPKASEIPSLLLCEDLASSLLLRSMGMQICGEFDYDALYETLPYQGPELFDEASCKRYRLDDYTRFVTMEETITEFISQVRVRRDIDGIREVQVMLNLPKVSNIFSSGSSALVLIDGYPVFDHEKVLDYNPALVEYVDIYPYSYLLGSKVFNGVVNFITFKRNLPSFTFSKNSIAVDYQGVSTRQAYTCKDVEDNASYPDYRQTAFWHPALRLEADATVSIPISLPSYKGRFKVKVEGLDADGKAVYSETTFENL